MSLEGAVMKQILVFCCLMQFLPALAQSGVTCDYMGVCWSTCKPIEVMVNDQRMHIRCESQYAAGLSYLAFPVENHFRTTINVERLTLSDAAHDRLYVQYLELAKAAMFGKETLLVGFNHAPTNEPYTEFWGCRLSDCSLIRSMTLRPR